MTRPSNLPDTINWTGSRDEIKRSDRNNFALLLVVHGVHGRISLGISRKAHEAESTTAQSGAILDDDLSIQGGLGSATLPSRGGDEVRGAGVAQDQY
ncbi:hypothetical protein F1880_009244 [Penicillium rolfsii]|nr:hypothetical protein F1880_009244 [Penicillium rolfsii]